MLKRNLVANFAGSAWSALMGLAFIPFYIRLMGVEAYGIIGVFASIQAMLTIMDLGLSQSMNREMARLSVSWENANRMADTARTLEGIYWAVGVVVVFVIVLLSNFIAYHWLNPDHVSRESLVWALWIMALVVGLRWPVSIYMGGLNGLQRQVLANALICIFTTLQGAGALAVLWFVRPTIHAFFVWQAVVALFQVITIRVAFWHSFSSGRNAKFSKDVLGETWRFAAGISGITITGIILTQMDKIVLSKMLTLTEFGYYTFAATVAAVLNKIIGPVFTTLYPRLTELVATDNHLGLVRTYHQGCQLMAVLVLPLALVLVFFSKEILEVWTHNNDVVAHSAILISLLVIGNALNGLLNLPYALQLAHGWTNLTLYTHATDVIVLAPCIYFATLRWGAVGAAAMWIVFNIGHILINVQLMHRHLLKGEMWRWYVEDVSKPLAVSMIVMGIAHYFARMFEGQIAIVIYITAITLIAFVGSIFVTTGIKNMIVDRIKLR